MREIYTTFADSWKTREFAETFNEFRRTPLKLDFETSNFVETFIDF